MSLSIYDIKHSVDEIYNTLLGFIEYIHDYVTIDMEIPDNNENTKGSRLNRFVYSGFIIGLLKGLLLGLYL